MRSVAVVARKEWGERLLLAADGFCWIQDDGVSGHGDIEKVPDGGQVDFFRGHAEGLPGSMVAEMLVQILPDVSRRDSGELQPTPVAVFEEAAGGPSRSSYGCARSRRGRG